MTSSETPSGIAAPACAPRTGPAASPGTGPAASAGLVHGMGRELAEPDWSPLTDEEVSAVLADYPEASPDGSEGDGSARSGAVVIWRSPRPMSAAALARSGGRTAGGAGGPLLRHSIVFVKRHHVRVRTAAQLTAEHAFASHLLARGVLVPAALRTRHGGTVTTCGEDGGEYTYEVHEAAPGLDLYRDAVSWSPFTSLGHARAAGAALARLHEAAASFPLPPRPPGVLMNSCAVIVAADPVAEVDRIRCERPGLARSLAGRDWQRDLTQHLLPAIRRAGPLLAALPRQWGHGDWHPSNLTWTSADDGADVAAAFDLGLANRTFAVHDLATALERCVVDWLDLAGRGRTDADLDAADALLDGYEAVRPLRPAEAVALPEVLPVVHLEYALSEIEYFADVVRSSANADLAYDGYLIGHARWFDGPEGSALLKHLRRRARLRRPPSLP